jgi:Rieske Fe-S protein
MTSNPTVSRRTALVAGVAGVAGASAVTLAACSGGGSPSTGTPTAAGRPLAKLDDLTVGKAVSAQVDGKDVIVTRQSADTAKCFSAICTHQGCTVRPDGNQLVCPCHGSVFDARTGNVVQGPAPTPLPEIPVTVSKGEVVTAPAGGA